MHKQLIGGNWNMQATHLGTRQEGQKRGYRLEPSDYERVEVVVCPPFTALRSAQTVIEVDHLRIGLGAQNVFWEEEGAYTGEVAAGMLAKLAVAYVIVGHSERRQLFGESDADANRKAGASPGHHMTPSPCVAEPEPDRAAGHPPGDPLTSPEVAASLAPAVSCFLKLNLSPRWRAASIISTDSPPGCPTMKGVPASRNASTSTSTVVDMITPLPDLDIGRPADVIHYV